VKHFRPLECYISDPSQPHWATKLFTFVEYSEKASEFLIQCGVKKAPSPDDMIELLIKDPQFFIDRAGGNERFVLKYLMFALLKPFSDSLRR
jgi:hypothetical protein